MIRHVLAMLLFFLTAVTLVLGSLATLVVPSLLPLVAWMGWFGVLCCAPLAGLHFASIAPAPWGSVYAITGFVIAFVSGLVLLTGLSLVAYPLLLLALPLCLGLAFALFLLIS